MKRFPKKLAVLLTAVTLLLTFTVSGTVAFLTENTESLTNTFIPVELDTVIVESVSEGQKTSIAVQNIQADNHIDVYVRVAVLGNWVDANGKIVAPWELTSYNTENWELDAGNFYYYKGVLAVGDTTPNLLSSAITEADKPDGAHHLEVTVVHQAIQAEPISAVTDAWGWTPPASSN